MLKQGDFMHLVQG